MYYNARVVYDVPRLGYRTVLWYDLTRGEMESQVASVFRNGRQFLKDGRAWPASAVQLIEIKQTEYSSEELSTMFWQYEEGGTVGGLDVDAYILHHSEDVTEEMLNGQPIRAATISADSQVDSMGIRDSLTRFQEEWPDPNKVAFIMMRFGETPAHRNIVDATTTALSPYGITGLRADHKQYHDDLFPNVLTYAHGCGFGIAVFERIEVEEFNPNISLEVGYMLAMGKPVCYLKDRTVKTLQSDLIGKLYRKFDAQDPMGTIPSEIAKWLSDKGYHPS